MCSPRFSTASLILVASLLGCGKTEPTASEPPAAGGPGFAPSGNAVFDQHCAKCHSVGEPSAGGPKGKSGGPNLSKVGADPKHTIEWLDQYIKDPKAQRPDSKMPKFDGKLTGEQTRSLAEFLAAKK